MRLFWEEQQKYLYLHKIMLHITTWTLILMLHIRQSIYLVLTHILSTSFLMFHITFNEISTTLSIQFWYKGRYTRYMRSNDMLILWNWISAIDNAVYRSCQNSTLLFINGLIFDITNTQNGQSLEFEWKPMLAPFRSANNRRFSWLCNVFLKLFQDWLNSVQKRQGNFEIDAGRKMVISWGDKHMKDWK